METHGVNVAPEEKQKLLLHIDDVIVHPLTSNTFDLLFNSPAKDLNVRIYSSLSFCLLLHVQ